MSGDIIFGSSPTFVLVIDTNQYSGNFEREMAAYCCGAYDGIHGNGSLIKFLEDKRLSGILSGIDDAVTLLPHCKYGNVSSSIWHNPNRNNSYESVAIFFDRIPTLEEMTIVKGRANNFAADNPGLTVLGIRLLSVRDIRHEEILQCL
jgi:hypothetical protein